jgi:sugar lactone lactonase YvrE
MLMGTVLAAGRAALVVSLPLVIVASCSGASRPGEVGEPSSEAGAGNDATTPGGGDDVVDSGHPATKDAAEDAAEEGDDGTSNDAGTDANTTPDVTTPPVEAMAGCETPDDAGPDYVLMMCGLQCVNIASDMTNCGGCSQPCGATVSGTLCVAGQCLCPSGQTACSNQCTDTQTDQNNCGTCGHSCQGAACAGGLCQMTVVVTVDSSEESFITDIAVDSTNVYWTQTNADQGAYYKPFSGGNHFLLNVPNVDPRGIVADGTHVYWTDYSTGGIYTYGTVVRAIQAPLLAPSDDGGAAANPVAITTDGTNVYWVDEVANTINEVPVTGGTSHVLATNQNNPVAVAVYGSSVYWLNYGSGNIANPNGSVNTVPVGSTNATVTTLVTSQPQPTNLVVDGTRVYWTNVGGPIGTGGTVNSYPTGTTNAAGAPTVLATNQDGPTGIAVDSQFVYWTNYNGGTVNKVALTGGTPFKIATGLNNPSSLTVDQNSVYWSNGDGNIDKVAK